MIDLAGIEGLNDSKNSEIIGSLTNNFSSVTNEILKLSPFYSNHPFQVNKHQEASMFHNYLNQTIKGDSRIGIMCCVSPVS